MDPLRGCLQKSQNYGFITVVCKAMGDVTDPTSNVSRGFSAVRVEEFEFIACLCFVDAGGGENKSLKIIITIFLGLH
jgi:hypothetical protein